MSDIEKLLWISAVSNIVLLAIRFYDAYNWRAKHIASLEHEIKILRGNWEISQETCSHLLNKINKYEASKSI